MRVRKAIIPAAGLGTRLLPNTKSIPKEMLPLVDKPVIQYIVEEAVAAGVEQILIITNRGKNPIEDYFDYAPDLEERLIRDGKKGEARIVREVADMADVFFLRQKETKGLGHAIWRAKSFVGDEPFGVLLGDDIMLSEKPVLKQLVEAAEANSCSAIAVREVPDELIVKYSSVKLEEKLSDRVYRISDMNEKPTLEEKLSQFAILGRYVLTPQIFDILEHTAPGRNNEIQLTDGMKELVHREPMCAVDFEGRRYDTGNLKGYLESIIDFALKNEEAGPWLKQFILDKAELLRRG
ncbi:MAG: UTP--glucose-1-phosphate uridylyltransferase GalU [Oscillospiraceae bacterium]|nr:UTP--glucose-1-phosphate uridylyltransferase GalU [Oscillospiraceae bacterium]